MTQQSLDFGTAAANDGEFLSTAFLKIQQNFDDLYANKQPLDADLTSWAGITRASGFDTFVATPSVANFNTLLTGADVATLAGTETLTNKTLTSPVITTSPTAAGATWTDLGTVTTADINGGTVDGAVIGGTSAAAGTFTDLVASGGLRVGFTGTPTADRVGVGDANLYLDFGGGTIPVLHFDSGDRLEYVRADNIVRMVIGGSITLAHGVQTVSVSPTGNSATTLSSFNLQGAAVSNSTREFLANLGMTSATGSGAVGDNRHKVVLYTGVVASSGTGDVWSYNPLVTMEAASGNYDAQIIEADLNNNNQHLGESDGGAGLATPVAYGITITGAGAFRSTAALGIFGPGTPIWNRGVVIGSDSVEQASFQDLGTSDISLDIRGTHTYGADFRNMTGTPIRVRNNTSIVARNAADGADVALLKLDASDNMLVGDGASLLYTSKSLIINHTAAIAGIGGTVHPLQSVNSGSGGISNSRFSADSGSAGFHFLKSRNATKGAHTIVQNGDVAGGFSFGASDGTNFLNLASILAEVDGTPGTNDMPGRLKFFTTADGAAAASVRYTINCDGQSVWLPGSVTPATLGTNGEFTLTPTSNTNFRISYRGSDGTTRVGDITLA